MSQKDNHVEKISLIRRGIDGKLVTAVVMYTDVALVQKEDAAVFAGLRNLDYLQDTRQLVHVPVTDFSHMTLSPDRDDSESFEEDTPTTVSISL